MLRRSAKVTESEIRRAIRALKQEGFEILRVVLTADGASVEVADRSAKASADEAEPEEREPWIMT
ncbi:hypothetical protein [Methylobacterium thuringiense]|uniref:Uncharacterized protein n=1 Tax=Methylobacterium thuringiense TaxID=1003091 RepID=A0ABQ4TPV0_9HYPH|nr:hypothetical protein [Methylobacterium thuringiense]GJE57331.1 hypothetical protein EKPJFOCH_3845 [Methylobacterium thuringiense]